MPSSSTISSSDKSKVKHALPSSANKILTATVARVYVAYPSQSAWSYTGIEGALAFVRDLSKNAFSLKVVDLKSDQGIIWEHELYEPLSYNQDRTFLHTLEGDDFVIAFAFADDGEATELHKKINNRQKYAKSSSKSSGSVLKKKSKAGGSGGTGKIDKSMISSPSHFKHVAHMGFTSEKGFSSENVDPTWAALLDQLTNMGVSRKDIEKNEGFIKDFVSQKGGPAASKAKKVPPPAPVRTTARKQPPPPPAPRSRASAVPAAPAPASVSAAPPAPPPPPARGAAAMPPPPPSRGPAAAPQAPPPPPLPPTRGSQAGPPPPPPPPPPPSSSGGGPPPPPPPPPAAVGAAIPAAPPPGRAGLLASIQGQSIHNLRKVDSSAGSGTGTPPPAPAAAAHGADDGGDGGGPDLASALAAALSARKENMGDSDEEESEEEW